MIENISGISQRVGIESSSNQEDSGSNSIYASKLQTQKNQKDRISQKEKMNENLLHILCERTESTLCNILKASSIRIKEQNKKFEERMEMIHNS